MPFVITRTDPKGIMLSEISQRQTLYVKSFLNKRELIDTENRLVAVRGRGWGVTAGQNG